MLGIFVTLNPVAIVRIVTEAEGEVQTFGDEVEFLLELQGSLDIVVPVFLVTSLCGLHPGVEGCTTFVLVSGPFTI